MSVDSHRFNPSPREPYGKWGGGKTTGFLWGMPEEIALPFTVKAAADPNGSKWEKCCFSSSYVIPERPCILIMVCKGRT